MYPLRGTGKAVRPLVLPRLHARAPERETAVCAGQAVALRPCHLPVPQLQPRAGSGLGRASRMVASCRNVPAVYREGSMTINRAIAIAVMLLVIAYVAMFLQG